MSDPIHIISLGAGVQSSTMALMAAHGEITPMPKCAIFADTQDEPASVYKWLDWLEKELPFPIHRVTAGSLSEGVTTLRERKDKNGFWARACVPAYTLGFDKSKGKAPRQCTSTFKIEPLDKEKRSLVGINIMKQWRSKHRKALKELSLYNKWLARWKKYKKLNVSKIGPRPIHPAWAWLECQADPLCIGWIGISLDEVHRVKQPRHPWENFRYPLIDKCMMRQNCLLWMQCNGYQEPPRSACVYCPYHSDAEWRRLRDQEPKEFAKAVSFEKKYQIARSKIFSTRTIPFLHSSRVPLDQVDFSTDEDHGQQVMFGNECEGMCGV